ncbi:FliH/SctL family protein [Sinorhizobium sp. 7-81]|uniref:FliH/SctL family protein n=1 Tax=Sinorhizobium sp. 8-89 TaxID=3049089 RepID=UPI0024C24259|nr:FliH/SctL family protein [Sinorhizobium sp. 8-89]MDK1492977.1 FliH/SctL family protein [Sinorhizobium sp. 8-89]
MPAASAQAMVDAEQLLDRARRDADALTAAARESVTMIETAAKEAGLKAAQAEIQDRLTAIAVGTLRIMEQNEQRIVDMALHIARRVIDTVAPENAAVDIALQSLRFVGESSVVRLRVTPSLVESVRKRLNELLTAMTSRSIVEVIPDPGVNDAGCILETDAGLVDATIEAQLALIESGLRNSLGASIR